MDFRDEPILTPSDVVSCDGDNIRFGHPKVYLNLTPEGQVVCPYCSQKFVLEGHPKKKSKKRAPKK